jgi:hypothetical protein
LKATHLERGNAWPFLDDVDQIRCSGIREGIGHLVEGVVGFDQAHDRSRLRGPEVFEAAKVSVLTAGEQPMKMLSEDRKIAVWVVDAGVMVIRHGDGEGNLDIRAHGGQSKAVDKCVIGIIIGAQEEAPFRTTPGTDRLPEALTGRTDRP